MYVLRWPRGATSFVRVSLRDLTQQIGENASVVVSKKWLESITGGIDELPPANIETSQIKEVEEPTPEIERIQFTIHDD